MSAEALLSRLNGVRRTGEGRYLARCPVHADKSPSFSIRELPDGRTICHCFAGCSTEEVLAAVGLTFESLYPERPIERGKPERRPFPAGDVLEALATEVRIAAICSSDLKSGKTLPAVDHERLMLAAERIESGRSLANG